MFGFTGSEITWGAATLLVAALMFAAQVTPKQAISNIAAWTLRPFGIHITWLEEPDADRIIRKFAWAAVPVLVVSGLILFLDISAMKDGPKALLIVGTLCLVGGVGWHLLRPSETPAAQGRIGPPYVAKTENGAVRDMSLPLKQAIFDFLAKNGHAGGYKPELIQVRDDSTGREFIAYWDQSLWPWPSAVAGNGFTADQLRTLPLTYPQLKTQQAKEKLGEALTELSEVVGRARGTADRANELRGGLPSLSDMSNHRGRWDRATNEARDLLTATLREMEFFDQGMLPKKYPLYRGEIAGTVPQPITQPHFIKLRDALIAFESFARLMAGMEKISGTGPLIEKTGAAYAPIYTDLSNAAGGLRDWSIDADRRIGMMLRAL